MAEAIIAHEKSPGERRAENLRFCQLTLSEPYVVGRVVRPMLIGQVIILIGPN